LHKKSLRESDAIGNVSKSCSIIEFILSNLQGFLTTEKHYTTYF
jgi:hypothetical protein